MAAANDTRFGDEEDGVLAGGLGNDSLSGGTGSAFVFTVSAGTDTIDLSMLPEVGTFADLRRTCCSIGGHTARPNAARACEGQHRGTAVS